MFKRIRQVYLDVNATTPVAPEVRRRMVEVIDKHPGNPSSAYRLGRDAAALIARARAEVAAAINASPSEVVFTSGASEGNNHVLRMVTARAPAPRRRLVTTAVEHSSVRRVAEELAGEGVTVTWLPVDRYGRVRPEDLAAALDDTVCLVSCMLANNELGTVNPVRELAALAHERGIPFHADCVQALGKIPVDVHDLGVDYATFSAHKVFGPKGVGVLYVRDGAPLHPFISGGHQEQERRAGTESTHNIAGCGAAFARVPELLAKVPVVSGTARRAPGPVAGGEAGLIENSPARGRRAEYLESPLPGRAECRAVGLPRPARRLRFRRLGLQRAGRQALARPHGHRPDGSGSAGEPAPEPVRRDLGRRHHLRGRSGRALRARGGPGDLADLTAADRRRVPG